jgi:hypothetical protein
MQTKADKFLSVAKPDENGKTELWLYTELEDLFPGTTFHTKNGGDWCRSDGQLRNYIIHREKRNNKTVGIQLLGFQNNAIQKGIKSEIHKSITSQNCCVTASSGNFIECDHKNGRYDNDVYGDIKNQKEEDFQPLHRNVNLAKRTHCKKCEDTNSRFDATQLGYSVGWTVGNSKFNGSCNGCYWYDPRKFNQIISAGFVNESLKI